MSQHAKSDHPATGEVPGPTKSPAAGAAESRPEPSAADRAVTTRLKQALALIDVRLLDHFVVADGPPVSLAARGWV